MKKYRSHKEVRAAKILGWKRNDDLSLEGSDPEFPYVPTEEFWKRAPETSTDFGYLVVYEDGFESWSPTKAFEDGYTEIKE